MNQAVATVSRESKRPIDHFRNVMGRIEYDDAGTGNDARAIRARWAGCTPMMNSNHGTMMDDLHAMGTDMQQFMNRMNTMMSDQALMHNPSIRKNMQQMQREIGSMMHSMDGVLSNVEQVRKVEKENPRL